MTKERMHELLDIAMHCDGIELVCQRLSGVSPAGFDQRLVEELAKRANKEQTGLADSTAVGQTKGGSELWRLVDELLREAVLIEETALLHRAKDLNPDRTPPESAVEKRKQASLLSALLSETQPQSEAEDVEEAGCREYLNGIGCQRRNEVLSDRCKQCPAGGNDVSGACLPNDQSEGSSSLNNQTETGA